MFSCWMHIYHVYMIVIHYILFDYTCIHLTMFDLLELGMNFEYTSCLLHTCCNEPVLTIENIMRFPDTLCMVYLPTWGWFGVNVGIYGSPMECLGLDMRALYLGALPAVHQPPASSVPSGAAGQQRTHRLVDTWNRHRPHGARGFPNDTMNVYLWDDVRDDANFVYTANWNPCVTTGTTLLYIYRIYILEALYCWNHIDSTESDSIYSYSHSFTGRWMSCELRVPSSLFESVEFSTPDKSRVKMLAEGRVLGGGGGNRMESRVASFRDKNRKSFPRHSC